LKALTISRIVPLSMPSAIPQPILRSPLRLALGKAFYRAKRRIEWHLPGRNYATARKSENLPHLHAKHGTPMLRELSGVDMQLQRNKMESLRIAASCIDGIVLQPGETFSFWRMVGKPTAARGFKLGLVLRNGTIQQDVGGGLCQMTNLIYWMAIHTDLEITERWRHGFDVFPDAGRTKPFASGATCAYNYIDLQIRNPTQQRFQLRLTTKEEWLHGQWRAEHPPAHRFEVFEKEHAIRQEFWGGYSRHNEIWRRRMDTRSGVVLGEELVSENHAIMMYEPLLPSPQSGS
jgi:vancomycin resistance protein VanW